MKIKTFLSTSVLATCAAMTSHASADEKLWTVSTGLNYTDSNYHLTGNKFDTESWSSYLGLLRRLDEKTSVGGSISYANANNHYDTLSGRADIDTTSLSIYATRMISWGLYATGSLGYGKSNIDTKTTAVSYDNDATFKTVSLGLTQYIPLSQNLMSHVGLSYSHISSDSDKFTTNLGNAVPSSSNTLNYITLGGGLSYRLDKWTPFVRLDWLKANREFIRTTGDKDYFSYSLGASYAATEAINIGLTLGSVFGKRDVDETRAGVNLSYQF